MMFFKKRKQKKKSYIQQNTRLQYSDNLTMVMEYTS